MQTLLIIYYSLFLTQALAISGLNCDVHSLHSLSLSSKIMQKVNVKIKKYLFYIYIFNTGAMIDNTIPGNKME